ncbi:hypothetical protein F01_260259 [Burkholderia cenocepacia]|nr:hypothetical protein F01_260259 [Burkholderia cenocepacia]
MRNAHALPRGRPFSWQPKLKIQSTGMPEIARMAASLVTCLARPNGAPRFLPAPRKDVPSGDERFRAFACAFRMQTDPQKETASEVPDAVG